MALVGSFCCGRPAEVLRDRVTLHQQLTGAAGAALSVAARLLWPVDARRLWVASPGDAGERGVVDLPPRDVLHKLHEGRMGQSHVGPYSMDWLT